MSETSSGEATWLTLDAGQAPVARGIRRVQLTVVSGPDAGLVTAFGQPRIRIGARAACDLRLADRHVSGLHCEILLEPGGFRLRDLDSRNGTRVLGLRVSDVFLPSGTLFEIGGSRLRFEALAETREVPLSPRRALGALVGESAVMRELYAAIEAAAPTTLSVVIGGETGSGKELVARALHELSPRAGGPFVVVDCAALVANLIEDELFGHERGAYTGAQGARAGAFEAAGGGTLFLDEIGELPLESQPRLLRALEARQVRRLGGNQYVDVDVRVVAATHRDLEREVERGRFREDLYFRLAVARLEVPPLRARREDIPALAAHILRELPGGERLTLETATLERLQRQDWPGNVRELRNILERVVFLGDAEPRSRAVEDETPVGGPPAGDQPIDVSTPYRVARQALVERWERRWLTEILAQHGGNISAAARTAGLDRISIHRMIRRLRSEE